MTREQLEHLLRASASILINSGSQSPTQELVVIGSQAILGQYPQAPVELLRSMEADLYPLREPELADAIDGAIGELSAFHDTYGYYAQGVGPETATLPAKWIDRVIPVQSEIDESEAELAHLPERRDRGAHIRVARDLHQRLDRPGDGAHLARDVLGAVRRLQQPLVGAELGIATTGIAGPGGRRTAQALPARSTDRRQA